MLENTSIEQQIADLERQIQEKRSSIEHSPADRESLPSDKEILHEVVGEKIQEHAPRYIPKIPSSAASTPTTDDTPSYYGPDLKDKVQELINIAFTKNIGEAVKLASDNPALLDAFHDVLVDELFNLLVERQKIKKVD